MWRSSTGFYRFVCLSDYACKKNVGYKCKTKLCSDDEGCWNIPFRLGFFLWQVLRVRLRMWVHAVSSINIHVETFCVIYCPRCYVYGWISTIPRNQSPLQSGNFTLFARLFLVNSWGYWFSELVDCFPFFLSFNILTCLPSLLSSPFDQEETFIRFGSAVLLHTSAAFVCPAWRNHRRSWGPRTLGKFVSLDRLTFCDEH